MSVEHVSETKLGSSAYYQAFSYRFVIVVSLMRQQCTSSKIRRTTAGDGQIKLPSSCRYILNLFMSFMLLPG